MPFRAGRDAERRAPRVLLDAWRTHMDQAGTGGRSCQTGDG